MDWDQIENKWAAMTRRVRADWTTDRASIKPPLARCVARMDPTTVQDLKAAPVLDERAKMSAE